MRSLNVRPQVSSFASFDLTAWLSLEKSYPPPPPKKKESLMCSTRATHLKFGGNLCDRECRITHVISILSASHLVFLPNKNAELAGGSQ